MIKEEMEDRTQEEQVEEGLENLTPENLQMAVDMLIKMSQEFAPVIAGSGLLAAAMKAKEMLAGGEEVLDDPQYYDDEIEEGAQRCDTGKIEQYGQRSGNDNRIDQHVAADPAAHAEMAMRDHLHIGQHRQHPRHRKNTRDDARRGGSDRDRDGEIETEIAKCRARRRRQ